MFCAFDETMGLQAVTNEENVLNSDEDQVGIVTSAESVDLEQQVVLTTEEPNTEQNLIIQHMDIGEPLTTLRTLLEARLQCSLTKHDFYLQDSVQLDEDKNLVSQCVQGTGIVQINIEVKSSPESNPRINIVDILKPAEEVVQVPESSPQKVVIPFSDESEHVTRWIVDQAFRKEQQRLRIPLDPLHWNESHVRHWAQWAQKKFQLVGVEPNNLHITGKQLCNMTHKEFARVFPIDKGDVFWTHLELLRKCKFVAVVQQSTPNAITTITVSSAGQSFNRSNKQQRTYMFPVDRASPGNRTGNNGQIQLWQFLLELLTDKSCKEIIQWIGVEGEFKLNNPELVAQMWGQRKNKPTMNYEKLSRALRYYYDGDMISKVHGKKFVYKFVCDLKMLLGYSAGELNCLVTECADKNNSSLRHTLHVTDPGTRYIPTIV